MTRRCPVGQGTTIPSSLPQQSTAEPSPLPSEHMGDVAACTGCAEGCPACARLAGVSAVRVGAHATSNTMETIRDSEDVRMANKGRGIFLVIGDIVDHNVTKF